MSDKRFTYDKPLVAFSKGGINDNVTGETYEFTMDTVLDLLNEQQATIERLTKRRDRWRELSNSFSAYCNCYEKAIERAFEEKPSPSEEDIYRIYAELEKELENE